MPIARGSPHAAGDISPPSLASILFQDPEGKWEKHHAEVMLRAQAAAARVQGRNDYADNVLAHLHVIRDRLATMEREAAALAAGIR